MSGLIKKRLDDVSRHRELRLRGFPGARTRKSGGANTVNSSLSGFAPPLAKRPLGVCQSGSAVSSAIKKPSGDATIVPRAEDSGTRSHSVTTLRFLVLLPRRIERRAHHADIRSRTALRRNFRALDHHAQVLFAKHGTFGQANFEGAERAIAGICRGHRRRENGCGPARRLETRISACAVGKLIARTEGVDAARAERCARAQGRQENRIRDLDSTSKMM